MLSSHQFSILGFGLGLDNTLLLRHQGQFQSIESDNFRASMVMILIATAHYRGGASIVL